MTQPSCLRYLVAFKDLDIPQDAILYLLSLPSHVAQHSKSSCRNPPVCAAVHQCQEIPGTGHIFPVPTAFLGFENCWKFSFLLPCYFWCGSCMVCMQAGMDMHVICISASLGIEKPQM